MEAPNATWNFGVSAANGDPTTSEAAEGVYFADWHGKCVTSYKLFSLFVRSMPNQLWSFDLQ